MTSVATGFLLSISAIILVGMGVIMRRYDIYSSGGLFVIATVFLILIPLFSAFANSVSMSGDITTNVEEVYPIAYAQWRVMRDAVQDLSDLHPRCDQILQHLNSSAGIVHHIRMDTLLCVPPKDDRKSTAAVLLPEMSALGGNRRVFGDALLREREFYLRNEPLRTMKSLRHDISQIGGQLIVLINHSNITPADNNARRIDVEKTHKTVLRALSIIDTQLIRMQTDLIAECDSQRDRHGGTWEFKYDGIHDQSTLPKYEYSGTKISVDRIEVPVAFVSTNWQSRLDNKKRVAYINYDDDFQRKPAQEALGIIDGENTSVENFTFDV